MNNCPRFRLFFILFLIGCLSSLSLNGQGNPRPSDGPYLFAEGDNWIVKWIDQGELKTGPNSPEEELEIAETISADFKACEFTPPGKFESSSAHFPAATKLAAISDIHGQYDLMIEILRNNGIIDQDNNWAFGDGSLVVVGDMFDRGPKVTETLWFLHKLEQQAPEAGGRVHVLLGNHEILILNGDLRYIHPKYRYSMAALERTYQAIFGPDSYFGQWLRSKPIAISIGDIAFVHGGFSDLYLDLRLSFEELNQRFVRKLVDTDLDAALDERELNILYLDYGPIWYRGYFDKEQTTKSTAKRILKKIGKSHIVVGHQSQKQIVSLFDNRIFGIDSSIKIGDKGEVLLYEDGNFFRGLKTGEKIQLE